MKSVVAFTLLLVACAAPTPVIPDVEPPTPPPPPPPETPVVPVATLTGFAITPRTDTLMPGDTLRFSAVASYSDSVVRPIAVTWSATRGVVDSTGLFTAGNLLGDVLVVVRCACALADSGAVVPDSISMDSARVTIVAPPPVVDSVTLRLHRMSGGPVDVLVSNGIPLPPGWHADPTATPPVRIMMAGVEVPSYVEVLKGKHADGSAMSLLVQFVWPATVTGDAVFELGAPSGLPARAKTQMNGLLPAAVALPTDPNYLVSTLVAGLTATRAASPQSPAYFVEYEQRFDQWGETHWATYGDAWAAMNFYDRVLSHFAFWVRTGNPVLWERAARIGIDYRDKYLEANDFGSSEWWAMLDGLALHYWLTGDNRSREAVYKTAESLHRSRGGEERLTNNTTHPWMDNRTQAKVLIGKVLSARLEAPPFGAVSDWSAQAKLDLGWILQTQHPTGPFLFQNICGASSNFMTGILSSAFIAYHDHVEQDPRVLSSLQRFQDWLWDTQWLPADQVYNYYSLPCETGGPGPAWDLNGLFLEAYGWLYAKTGDAKYRDRGDATFAGLVAKTWFTQTKMYNQAFQFSWKYLGYRK